MGALFSQPSMPPVPVVPPAANPTTSANPAAAQAAAQQARSRAAAAASMSGENPMPGANALKPPTTAQQTLLGGA